MFKQQHQQQQQQQNNQKTATTTTNNSKTKQKNNENLAQKVSSFNDLKNVKSGKDKDALSDIRHRTSSDTDGIRHQKASDLNGIRPDIVIHRWRTYQTFFDDEE